jgi:flagella basal body P-ring formation protein FlgA
MRWVVLLCGGVALAGWAQPRLDSAAFSRAARECLQGVLGRELPVELRWLSLPSLPTGVTEVRCVSDSVLLRQGRFVFEAWASGVWVGRYGVSGLVWVVAPEVRLAQSVEAGDVIEPGQVRHVVRRMTLAEYFQRVQPEEVGHVRARRALAAGAVLLRQDCLLPEGVRRGERVTILARVGAVEVRASGQALEDGQPGQWIRVRREGATQLLRARVRDRSTVEVGQPVQNP